jgi:hypothetical protein
MAKTTHKAKGLKTVPTKASVGDYLDSIADETRRKDCKAVAALMKKVTGVQARMWGSSVVGFGSYHYKYASGREGDTCLVGFSSRKSALVIYLLEAFEGRQALLSALGPHTTGAACLYVKRLADIQLAVLERLIAKSVAEARRRSG